MKIAVLTAVLLNASIPNSPPARTGDCKWVHGRFAIYNGSGVRRIWLIGTHRIIAIYDEDDKIPPAIARYQSNATDYRGFDDALYGEFYVCALEPSRPGWMQHVRIVRTRKLIFRGKPYFAKGSWGPVRDVR